MRCPCSSGQYFQDHNESHEHQGKAGSYSGANAWNEKQKHGDSGRNTLAHPLVPHGPRLPQAGMAGSVEHQNGQQRKDEYCPKRRGERVQERVAEDKRGFRGNGGT